MFPYPALGTMEVIDVRALVVLVMSRNPIAYPILSGMTGSTLES